jgi:glycosyltransferase involved in cell wall biosynthesis
MRVAIVHDWLTVYGGAEQVLQQMLALFPESDLFTLVDFLPDRDRDFVRNKAIKTSFLQYMPFARKKYRQYLPLMPLAVEQFDLSGYDLVISSSHAVAKGVITGPDQLHLSYVHSPMRYAWDLQHQYLKEAHLDKGIRSWLARWMLHKMRLWDLRTANGVDGFMANSQFIARRVWKVHHRKAVVIYPPVNIEAFTLHTQKENFYLTVSRMVPYKKIPLIVETFSAMPEKELFVIGDGPEFNKVKSLAGSNIKLLGYQPISVVISYMQRARAFIFAAEEDFGIAPLEAQACGTPVIAYGKGGVTETVSQETGIFFTQQTVESIRNAVRQFESAISHFSPERIRQNAERFSPERFRQEFSQFIEEQWKNFKGSPS